MGEPLTFRPPLRYCQFAISDPAGETQIGDFCAKQQGSRRTCYFNNRKVSFLQARASDNVVLKCNGWFLRHAQKEKLKNDRLVK